MAKTRTIWCCGCSTEVAARLTDGREVYPHRRDLAQLPFWKCDACGNTVGCHHKTKNRTRPLGCIPTQEIKDARQHIHRALDPLWKGGGRDRKEVYRQIAAALSIAEYHTAEIRTVEEARRVYAAIKTIASSSTEATSP